MVGKKVEVARNAKRHKTSVSSTYCMKKAYVKTE